MNAKQKQAEAKKTAPLTTVEANSHEPIDRLERVRALPEVDVSENVQQMTGGIEFFKDGDERTMRVCVFDGELCKQALEVK